MIAHIAASNDRGSSIGRWDRSRQVSTRSMISVCGGGGLSAFG